MARHLDTEVLWGLAGEPATAADQDEALGHLRSCARCTAKLQELEAARRLLRADVPPELSPNRWATLDARVLASARDLAHVARREHHQPRWALMLGSVAVAAAATALALLWVRPGPRVPPRAIVAATTAHPLPAGPKLSAAAQLPTLPTPIEAPLGISPTLTPTQVVSASGHSTRVQLAGSSRLALLGEGTALVRQQPGVGAAVDLERGILLVSGSHDRGHRLAIRAGSVEIEMVGTRFLVARSGTEGAVAVDQGLVLVRQGPRSRTLGGGESLRWSLTGAPWRPLTAMEQRKLLNLVRSAMVASAIPARRRDAGPAPRSGEPAHRTPEPSPGPPPPATVAPKPSPPAQPPPLDVLSGLLPPALAREVRQTLPALVDDATNNLSHRLAELQKLAQHGLCDELPSKADDLLSNLGQRDPAVRRQVLLLEADCFQQLGRPEQAKRLKAQAGLPVR